MVSVMAAVENLNEVIISFFPHLHLLRMCVHCRAETTSSFIPESGV